MNAFSLYSKRLRFFDNDTVTPDIYNAAQSMFMLFPPVRVENDLLTTGASRDPTGLQAIWLKERDKLSTVLALDPLARCFWREPTDAYDAFQLMLMNPIVALQQLMYCLYSRTDQIVNTLAGQSCTPTGGSEAAAPLRHPGRHPQGPLADDAQVDPRKRRGPAGIRLPGGAADRGPARVRGDRAFIDGEVDRDGLDSGRDSSSLSRGRSNSSGRSLRSSRTHAEFIAPDKMETRVFSRGAKRPATRRRPRAHGQSGREVTS